MKYDFDEIIDRRGTDAIKTDHVADVCGREDVIPMWVADMDFATPPFVTAAVQKRLEQRILGYTAAGEKYRESIVGWCSGHYGWEISPEDICYIPGVVRGIYAAVQAFTEKGDTILIQDPVYTPFRAVPEGCGRKIRWNKLLRTEDGFAMDLEALRRDVRGCAMMILCNPHNPGGICWEAETLREVARICAEEGTLVISDEIHCDMTLGGRRHIPFASLCEEAARISITFQAPSKTFNMPGIVCSHAIVVDPGLREKFFGYLSRTDMDLGNVFCYACASACYSEEGEEWRRQMLAYVEGNIDAFIRGLSPCGLLRLFRPKASYLMFMDCTGLMEAIAPGATPEKGQEALVRFFADECGVAFNPGIQFGSGGAGFMRVNLGCPRSTVDKAVRQIIGGLKARKLLA